MNQSTNMLRLAAATLASALATTVMAENGKPSIASNRSYDGGARQIQHQWPRTGGELKPGHPKVTTKGRPVISSSNKAPKFEIDRPGRQYDDFNELEYLEIIRCSWGDPFGFSTGDSGADGADRKYGDVRWLQTEEGKSVDLDWEQAGRNQGDVRWIQTAEADGEEARWSLDDLESDHADAPDLILEDPMDIDRNGTVDMQDFGLLMAAFGGAEHDLNGDGLVDGRDLGLMLARMTPLVAVD